jgi:hypothetical protein
MFLNNMKFLKPLRCFRNWKSLEKFGMEMFANEDCNCILFCKYPQPKEKQNDKETIFKYTKGGSSKN